MEKSPTLGLSHVSLSVNNVNASREFFEALGFHELPEMECSMPSHSLVLTDGMAIITLGQIQGKATPFDRRHNIGLHHISIRVRTMDDLAGLYKKSLKVPGVKDEFAPAPLEGTDMVRATVYEPSGIRVELTYHKIK
jgi:lactoylglutathione lyase